MSRISELLVALLLLTFSSSAFAVDLHEIEVRTGIDGLVEVPISIINSTASPVLCIGALAHWYSEEVALIGAGEMAGFSLWFDPQTGTYALLNEHDENMPVESLWCGFAGKAYETRSRLTLELVENTDPEPLAVSCRKDGARLRCE